MRLTAALFLAVTAILLAVATFIVNENQTELLTVAVIILGVAVAVSERPAG